jgi:hypothetical protein
MPRQLYVFAADLVGHPGVRRTIAVRSDQTLVVLHHACRRCSSGMTTTSTRSG